MLHLSSDYHLAAAQITRPFLTKHLAAGHSGGCTIGSKTAAWTGCPRTEAGCLQDTNHNSCMGVHFGQLAWQGTELAAEQNAPGHRSEFIAVWAARCKWDSLS